MNGQFVEVSPPAKAPVHQIAETLGLVDGLQAERSQRGQWRCCQCRKMQPDKSWMVWVPDGVLKGDPDWSITENCRRNAYNGQMSAWCLPCAPKAIKKKANKEEIHGEVGSEFGAAPKALSWWSRLFSWTI